MELFYDIIIFGDLMKREDIEFWLIVAILILLVVFIVRSIIAILPIIVVVLVGLLIYDSIKKRKNNPSKKDTKIKEAKIIREKNID